MKLLTKTGLNFISASAFLFFFGTMGGFYFIGFAINNYLNSELVSTSELLSQLPEEEWMAHGKMLANADVEMALEREAGMNPVFSDTIRMDPQTGKPNVYRKMEYVYPVGNRLLKVKLYHSREKTDLLLAKLTLVLTVFPILFFIALYLVNRHTTKRSLAVFYDTIGQLERFDVNKNNRLQLMTSDVDEFERLKEVFNAMDMQIREDFVRLKEYTENTSHELQTPLAIIMSRLEELLQAENLTPGQLKLVADLMETTTRLSKINQSLIFLAKIDNRFYSQTQDVDLQKIIHSQLDFLQPLIEDRDIRLTMEYNGPLVVKMNPSLAETLIQNLLKNAIRHNVEHGYLTIQLQPGMLVVKNSGKPLDVAPNELFERFRRNSSHSQSMGIGLSIVHRICTISNVKINYFNEGDEHRFVLEFA
jgi:hypothetical protein